MPDALVERLLSGQGGPDDLGDDAGTARLDQALSMLRATIPTAPPAPRGDLVAMLERGLPPAPNGRSGASRRRFVALSALTGLTVAGGLVGAGAAAALPDGMQHRMAEVVDTLTPFRLPDPQDRPAPRRPSPTPTDGATLAPSPTPAPRETDRHEPGNGAVVGRPEAESRNTPVDRGDEPAEPPATRERPETERSPDAVEPRRETPHPEESPREAPHAPEPEPTKSPTEDAPAAAAPVPDSAD